MHGLPEAAKGVESSAASPPRWCLGDLVEVLLVAVAPRPAPADAANDRQVLSFRGQMLPLAVFEFVDFDALAGSRLKDIWILPDLAPQEWLFALGRFGRVSDGVLTFLAQLGGLDREDRSIQVPPQTLLVCKLLLKLPNLAADMVQSVALDFLRLASRELVVEEREEPVTLLVLFERGLGREVELLLSGRADDPAFGVQSTVPGEGRVVGEPVHHSRVKLFPNLLQALATLAASIESLGSHFAVTQ